MTPDEIEAMVLALPPLPWNTESHIGADWNIESADGKSVAIASQFMSVTYDLKQDKRRAVANFIAASPTIILQLVAQIRQLQADNDKVHADLERELNTNSALVSAQTIKRKKSR